MLARLSVQMRTQRHKAIGTESNTLESGKDNRNRPLSWLSVECVSHKRLAQIGCFYKYLSISKRSRTCQKLGHKIGKWSIPWFKIVLGLRLLGMQEFVKPIAKQLMRAVQQLHELSIVHNDISAEN
eukprot:5463490-Amphidinium_carterae.1